MSVSDRLFGFGLGVRFREGDGSRRRRIKSSSKFVAGVSPLEQRCLLSGVVGGSHSSAAQAHHEAVVEHRTALRIATLERQEAFVEHRADLTIAALQRREAALDGRAPFRVAALQRREAIVQHRADLRVAAIQRRIAALEPQGAGGGFTGNPPIFGIITAPTSQPPAWAELPTQTGNSQNEPDKVMYQPENTPNSLKSVTITNNFDETIYPVLEGNNRFSNDGKRYDPNDAGNHEYRIYVGFKATDGKYYAGLPAGQSVTFHVPQAIWDSGRINFVTANALTKSSFWASGDPFNYNSSALTYLKTLDGDGVLFEYHATQPEGFNDAAANQVAEFTIRDHAFTTDLPNSIDVDVQYIDSMFLPVAMEAVLPQKGAKQAGYIGTLSSVPDFQNTLRKFIQASGSSLNGYFGTKGWPQFYLNSDGAIDPNALIKIPGGYNVFAYSALPSPLKNSLPQFPYLTSSQTTGILPGTPSDAPNYAVQGITNLIYSWAQWYQKQWKSGVSMPGTYLPPTPQLATILDTGLQQAGVQTYDIKTSGPADLKRAKDFASTLWYALWAFSQDPDLNTNLRYIEATGTTTAGSNLLTELPASTVSQLKNAMGVVGPNVSVRTNVNNPGNQPPSATSIQMSQPASGNGTATYRFYYDTLPVADGGQPFLQATSQLIGFLLGDNVGDLTNVPGFTTKEQRQEFTNNTVIPLMRGVPGTKYLPPNGYPQTDWYPTPGNPKLATEAKYNIDPLVWLVHTNSNWPPSNQAPLAYAFSVDDGIGNILVNDSNDFQVAVGGSNGLTNKYPYSQ